jgi:asparagine synthase (glutamine-hydrolysing)
MCGIAGIYAYHHAAKPVDRAELQRIRDHMAARGPDGLGEWASADDRVVLGHRRLAIIETGAAGAQPMSDVTGRWTITFNGEIYNYRELRVELERRGRRLLTHSDTEVLINVVAEWGESGLKKLRGMFAFALWDSLERELWLVRDPYGIKPLYVAERAGTIWFASQARALATCAPVDTATCPAALTGFYLWGHVPEPFSWWTGIRMLPAGHVQRIRTGETPGAPIPYARVEDAYVSRPPRAGTVDELRELLRESVQYHLVADVPVGIFLSAGVDSTVVAALAAEFGTRLITVTLAFKEYAGTDQDEAPLAEIVARTLGTRHVTVHIDREEFEGQLDDFFASMDQPSIDGLNTYLVSRAAASQGLKVVLSGLGGDELFGGYGSFRQIPMLLKWGARLSGLRALGIRVPRILSTMAPSHFSPKLSGLLSHSNNIVQAYALRRSLRLADELAMLLDKGVLDDGLAKLSSIDAGDRIILSLREQGASLHAQIAALESCCYMRNQLLRDTDWASMAHGLEVRVPFVDHHLLAQLGPWIASSDPPTKQDLARSTTISLETISKRPKTGFTTPVQAWTARSTGHSTRGLRGWANEVHRRFRALGSAGAAKIPWNRVA